jgi:tRNA dimethylallyltransferase
MIPIITIEGATASGKSALAIQLAKLINAQIISADSRQVYRYLDIGTAKVSKEEQQQVPHHLIDIIDPDASYNAGAFCTDASAIIDRLHQNGIVPIVCGGTGLYVRSLLHGLFTLPNLPTELRLELKERLNQEGLNSLYKQLQSLDPAFASKISANDQQRVLRGLEVVLGTGMPISEHWRLQQAQPRYLAFRILVDIPRPILYSRINERIHSMLAAGLLEEIQSLHHRGWTANCPGLNSLGYKEFLPFFVSGANLEECTNLAAQHTRNYAKRQCTWYRKTTFDLTISTFPVRLSEIIHNLEEVFSRGV